MLGWTLDQVLKLLHPFMPFITETLWQQTADRDGFLMLEAWRLDFLPAVIVIAATLWFLAILAAGTRVAMSIPLDRAILATGGAYMAWWVVGSIFNF